MAQDVADPLAAPVVAERLLALSATAQTARLAVLQARLDVMLAKRHLLLMEDLARLNDRLTGRNEAERAAQVRNLTVEESLAVDAAERTLLEAQTALATAEEELATWRTIARLVPQHA